VLMDHGFGGRYFGHGCQRHQTNRWRPQSKIAVLCPPVSARIRGEG
jgi:hypothetical protein